MSILDGIILAFIALLAGGACFYLRKQKKEGKGCAGCPGCGGCTGCGGYRENLTDHEHGKEGAGLVDSRKK